MPLPTLAVSALAVPPLTAFPLPAAPPALLRGRRVQPLPPALALTALDGLARALVDAAWALIELA